jgi:TRIAD3 protein (E3 ubiquitin-protein ligase RNF216)
VIDVDSQDDDMIDVNRIAVNRVAVNRIPINVDSHRTVNPPRVAAAAAASNDALTQILEIFPDADPTHVRGMLANPKLGGNIALVVHSMTDTDYPKAAKRAQLNATAPCAAVASATGATNRVPTYDFMASDSFTPSDAYITQARQQLRTDFGFLSVAAAQAILLQQSQHYAKAHEVILQILKGGAKRSDEEQYQRVQTALAGKGLSNDQMAALEALMPGRRKAVLKSAFNRKRAAQPSDMDAILKEEVMYVRGKLDTFLETNRQAALRERNKNAAQAAGVDMPCGCCYDGYAIEDMVVCHRGGHLFCVDCMRHYAEQQIFGNGNLGVDSTTKRANLELRCMEGECTSGFSREFLQKSFSVATLRKYDELHFEQCVAAAGLDEVIVTCPRCRLQAELPKELKVFPCPECGYASCRECGEEAHVPLR